MRHSLSRTAYAVLLAGLAFQAQAQSNNVVLYGLLDLNVSNYDSGSVANAGNVTKLIDGTTNGLNGSRWGIRTTEDLGDGLKAGVVMEAGLTADNGALAQGGRAFGRQIFISLASATLGEVRFGRQYILEDAVMFNSNPFGNALTLNPSTSVTNMGKNLPLWLNAPRADNVLQYSTPTWSGFSLAGQIAPGEATADRFHGLRGSYAAGNFYSALSYEWGEDRFNGAKTNKSMTLAANYNFGAFKLLGGYQDNSDVTTTSGNGAAVNVSNKLVTGPGGSFTFKDFKGYTVGTEIYSGVFTWGANYTALEYSGQGKDATLGKMAFGVRYGFSKNTFAYSSISFATGDLKEHISEERVMQVGLRTAF
jgi:predicted porin